MRDLNYRLKGICNRNRDGSYSTRSRRWKELNLMANQLHEIGYTRFKDPHKLKGRHVTALVERWKAEGLSAGTIKTRMATLRWWAEKVGRESVVDPRNAAYGIGERQYVTNESKAVFMTHGDLDKVKGCAHPRQPGVAARLRPAAGGVPEVPAAFCGPGRQAGAQGVVVQGRARAGNSDSHRGSSGRC